MPKSEIGCTQFWNLHPLEPHWLACGSRQEKQTKEQLIIFLMNRQHTEDSLRERLFLLSGCGDFGRHDGTVGSCVECYIDNPQQFSRCVLFSDAIRSYQKETANKQKKTK